MPQAKQASKQKRVAKAAVPALGAAGLSFGLVGGAFASATPTADVPQKLNFAPTQAVTLDEEEMADGWCLFLTDLIAAAHDRSLLNSAS